MLSIDDPDSLKYIYLESEHHDSADLSMKTTNCLWENKFEPITLHAAVYSSGRPNFKESKLPVPSTMNIGLWHELITGYQDTEVVDFLTYGWPLGYVKETLPVTAVKNHKSALQFSGHIDDYIQKELSYGAIIGPFEENPFDIPLAFSPLSSVPKKDSVERRTVMDLSFPDGTSVNDGIPKATYLGDPFKLHYPATDHLIKLINDKGPMCLLYKVDIKRCYRWLPVDPFDFHLLGMSWRDKVYFDTKMPFGVRTGAMAAQRTTNAIMYMYRNMGFDAVNYIDDIGSAEHSAKANEGYVSLIGLVEQLGFPVANEKCSPPSTNMVFLGKLFDTDSMTISIPQAKLEEIKQSINLIIKRKTVTRKQLESIIGKLSYIADCVRSARLFICRLLDLLRSVTRKHHHINLSSEAKKDLKWFLLFMESYNGRTAVPEDVWCTPDQILATDSTLVGIGGVYHSSSGLQFFHDEIPCAWHGQHICVYEMLAILVAILLWGAHIRNKRIIVHCDNSSCVSLLNTGRCRDKLMVCIARNIWLKCAQDNIQIKGLHIPTTENRLPDLLSRWSLSDSIPDQFMSLLPAQSCEICVPPQCYDLDMSI